MSTKKTSIIILLASLALTACEPPPNAMPMAEGRDMGRVKVEQIGQFKDSLAYSGWRGVYIITDSKTGREFIGVSGVGISENGSHQAGKNHRVEDER